MATRKKAAKSGPAARRGRTTRRAAKKTSELEELLRELIAKIDLLVRELRECRPTSSGMAPELAKKSIGMTTALAKKSITADTIWERVQQIFGADTKVDTPLKKKYFGDIGGLVDKLNAHPPFATHKLYLMPGNLKGVDSMGGVGAAIVKWYKKNGWTVTVDFD